MDNERESKPTELDLERLPRLARVAFAARCARRVQMLHSGWSGVTRQDRFAIGEAILFAEGTASSASATFKIDVASIDVTIANAFRAVANAGAFAVHARVKHGVSVDTLSAARAKADSHIAVAHAATGTDDWSRAAASVHSAHAADAAQTAGVDAVAAYYAAWAGYWVAVAARSATAAAATEPSKRDFDRLVHLTNADGWTDSTPVDVAGLGPLWPQDALPKWAGVPQSDSPVEREVAAASTPESTSQPTLDPVNQPAPTKIRVVVESGGASREEIQALFTALSELHIANGGLGLEFSVDDAHVRVSEGVRSC